MTAATLNRRPRRLKRIRFGDILIMLVITLLCGTCVLPFIHLTAKSLSSNSAALAQIVTLWPIGFNVNAYASIIRDGQLTYSLGYTVVVTSIFTALGMIVTVCAAYPLSKKRLRGRAFIATFIMLTLYFNAGLIPQYLLYKQLGLIDRMWVLILPLMFSPYNMLIMKSFFQSTIPDSLEESAFLDGASNFQILFRIVLPLSKPILATIALFYAVGRWNAFADAKYFITTKRLQPLQYLLSNMILNQSTEAFSLSESANIQNTPEVLQAAMTVFTTAPILILYPFVQRHFVKGVMIGAVKG